MKSLRYFVIAPLCLLLNTAAIAETQLNAQEVRNLFANKTVNSAVFFQMGKWAQRLGL